MGSINNRGGGGGGGVSTLQQAYDNSSPPRIVENSAQGTLSLKIGTGLANIDSLLNFVDNSDTITAFILGDGSADFAGTLNVGGVSTFGDDIQIDGDLTLLGSTSGSFSLRAAAVAGSPATWVMPTTNGSAGNILSTDGAGNLSWATAASSVWGAITGTLSNQTDLQNALDDKVDVSGDTMTGALSINTIPGPPTNLVTITSDNIDYTKGHPDATFSLSLNTTDYITINTFTATTPWIDLIQETYVSSDFIAEQDVYFTNLGTTNNGILTITNTGLVQNSGYTLGDVGYIRYYSATRVIYSDNLADAGTTIASVGANTIDIQSRRGTNDYGGASNSVLYGLYNEISSTGDLCVALGYNNTISFTGSGSNTVTHVVTGVSNTVTPNLAGSAPLIVYGSVNTVNGCTNTLVLGRANSIGSNGNNSIFIGLGITATGGTPQNASFVGGGTVSGSAGTGIGQSVSLTGSNAIVIGRSTTANQSSAIAIGTSASATHSFGVAIGGGSATTAANTVTLGNTAGTGSNPRLNLRVTGNTAATSTTAAAVVVDGGVGIADSLWVGTQLVVANNVTAPSSLPTGTLAEFQAANGAIGRVLIDAYGTGTYASYGGRSARGTAATPTALQSGDEMTHLSARGYGATGYSSAPRAYLSMFAAENWTDAAQGTRIGFFTTAPTTTTTSEKVRIWGDGGVTISTTPISSPGVGSLDVAGTNTNAANAFFARIGNQGTLTASSGTQYGFIVNPTIGQTGTASYTAFLLNITEATIGSGSQLLVDLQVGAVSKFSISNTGLTTIGQLTGTATSVVGATAGNSLTTITLGSGLSLTGGTLDVSGSFSPALSATYVGYGSGANVLTGEAAFTYDESLNLLNVGNIAVTDEIVQGSISTRKVTTASAIVATTDYDPIVHSTNKGTIKYLIKMNDGTTTRSSELIATYDGSSVNYTEYGTVEVGGSYAGASLSVVSDGGGNIVLRLTRTSGTHLIRISREHLI